ncbi:hypothetical protein RUM43_000487, partial [Polyplax serrata]
VDIPASVDWTRHHPDVLLPKQTTSLLLLSQNTFTQLTGIKRNNRKSTGVKNFMV